ncbi:ParB/RepB/Spo0J family partition protein [Ahrensia sp. R2A130]|uniref:ParB/RepB/Spo0J family partition protein n=1 Tax=Ahrensia sp. R2A130 TaxID=744979 RepID=UPI0001E0AC8E|nr:ParB/RepB/Spo0J family partition protein [Ahrensia sp. R2A130]EFL89695.1 chromosome-partitioning protein ParB [Ahrensia sp. R2A130]
MAQEPKPRLGRGLAALIGDMDSPASNQAGSVTSEAPAAPVMADTHVAIEKIRANPNNPRRTFSESDLDDLSRSLKEHGLLQPLLVRHTSGDPDHDYELIAGERRWRASQRAGLHSVPIVVRDVDDRQALELAIIENVQRADLNPVEEAQGYEQLMDDHSYTQNDLAQTIGKSRSHVANTLRLLKLTAPVRALLVEGALSAGHARALITLDNPEEIAQRIVKDGLSVRQVEQIVADANDSQPVSSATPKETNPRYDDANSRALERTLSDALGMNVKLTHRASGKGRLVIDYKSLEQLDELELRLTRSK